MADSNFPTPDHGAEEQDELIELIDEDGNPTLFDHLATLEYEGETYLALAEPDADEQDQEELSVIIMKIQQDENGDDLYVQPEPEEEEAVFEAFLNMIDEMDEGGE